MTGLIFLNVQPRNFNLFFCFLWLKNQIACKKIFSVLIFESVGSTDYNNWWFVLRSSTRSTVRSQIQIRHKGISYPKQNKKNLIYTTVRDSQEQVCNWKTKDYWAWRLPQTLPFSALRTRCSSFSTSPNINQQFTSSKQNTLLLGTGEKKSKSQEVAFFLSRQMKGT